MGYEVAKPVLDPSLPWQPMEDVLEGPNPKVGRQSGTGATASGTTVACITQQCEHKPPARVTVHHTGIIEILPRELWKRAMGGHSDQADIIKDRQHESRSQEKTQKNRRLPVGSSHQ